MRVECEMNLCVIYWPDPQVPSRCDPLLTYFPISQQNRVNPKDLQQMEHRTEGPDL